MYVTINLNVDNSKCVHGNYNLKLPKLSEEVGRTLTVWRVRFCVYKNKTNHFISTTIFLSKITLSLRKRLSQNSCKREESFRRIRYGRTFITTWFTFWLWTRTRKSPRNSWFNVYRLPWFNATVTCRSLMSKIRYWMSFWPSIGKASRSRNIQVHKPRWPCLITC